MHEVIGAFNPSSYIPESTTALGNHMGGAGNAKPHLENADQPRSSPSIVRCNRKHDRGSEKDKSVGQANGAGHYITQKLVFMLVPPLLSRPEGTPNQSFPEICRLKSDIRAKDKLHLHPNSDLHTP